MKKPWLDWFSGQTEGDADRRGKSASAIPTLDSADLDLATGTVVWPKFMAILEAEKAQLPGALLVIDLERPAADLASNTENGRAEILPLLAQAIKQAIRHEDLVTHVYDYRFAVLLRGAAQEIADTVADRIRASVDDTLFMSVDGILRLGVDVGGVVYLPTSARQDDIIAAAMTNLGAARSNDRHILIQ